MVIYFKKFFVVIVFDDGIWWMWGLLVGDFIMIGEGYKDWVFGFDFYLK